jgi:hypothetical protein
MISDEVERSPFSVTSSRRVFGEVLVYVILTHIAIDGAGNIWVTNSNSISLLSNSGGPISPPSGYRGTELTNTSGIAIAESGNVWIADTSTSSISEFVGIAVPVVTPQATAVKTNWGHAHS